MTTTTNAQPVSATIHQFPARGRFARSAAHEDVKAAGVPAPRVASGSGWYHDEAIEAERARKS
jgi:hypothetical protein